MFRVVLFPALSFIIAETVTTSPSAKPPLNASKTVFVILIVLFLSISPETIVYNEPKSSAMLPALALN